MGDTQGFMKFDRELPKRRRIEVRQSCLGAVNLLCVARIF